MDEDKADASRATSPAKDVKRKMAPQVFILSSGDVTPFELRVRPDVGEKGISLEVAANGTVKTTRDNR